jgi:hypothetical protein
LEGAATECFVQEVVDINEQLKKAIKRLTELDHYSAGEVFKSKPIFSSDFDV